MDKQAIKDRLQDKGQAYKAIYEGTNQLLQEPDYLFWTERFVMRLVNWIAQQRLNQLGELPIDDNSGQ